MQKAVELERPYLGESWEVEEPLRLDLEPEYDIEELNDPNGPYLVMLNILSDDVETNNGTTRRSRHQKSAKKKI